MEFTEEQVRVAKQCRDTIIAEDIEELKSIYMAGEIVMWDEMKDKNLSSNSMLADSLPLSDEEIEKEAEKRYGEVTGGSYHAARPMDKARFIKGAKWVRDFKR